jgi:hypothetical protein
MTDDLRIPTFAQGGAVQLVVGSPQGATAKLKFDAASSSSPPRRRAWPVGFSYRDDRIAPDEAAGLVARFAALPFQPFEFHGYLGKRPIVSFGWRYDYAGRALRESAAMPDFLLPCGRRRWHSPVWPATAPLEPLEK